MADATGETKEPLRVAFDRRLKLEFNGAKMTSDGGLLAYRELDDALGLTTTRVSALAEGRRGKNLRHRLLGLLRQAIYGRIAGYEDVNDAERLARDPAMRAIVGREGLGRPAASTSQMGRSETEWLATDANLDALTALPGTWIDRVHKRRPPDASSWIWTVRKVRPTVSRRARPGTAISAARATTRCSSSTSSAISSAAPCGPATYTAPRVGGTMLEPVVARYRERGLDLYFRGDAGFAKPELYELLEAEGIGYAIRLPANAVLQERIAHLLTRPVGRPPKKPQVFFASFTYQAQSCRGRVGSWPRWSGTKASCTRGSGFIVTTLTRPAERVSKFYNGRGTAEQWIKEGKQALRWTRLSCHAFRDNAVRLQLHALAYNLANFLRSLALPKEVEQWSLTTLREKLVKIGARIVRHGRYVVFQLAEVAVPRALFASILRRIDRLRPRPLLT